ncbi:MAG: hypothetical protein WD467_00060 [Candidatus Saccharimonadales bacterium]
MQKNPEEIQNIIDQLSKLLATGGANLSEVTQLIAQGIDLTGRNVLPTDTIDQWNSTVRELLSKAFGESHHYVHRFSHPQLSKGSLTDVPKTLEEYVVTLEARLFTLEDFINKLEDKKIQTMRKAVTEREYNASPKYWLRYNPMGGKLLLNDKIVLAKPQLDSPADKLLQVAFENPNTVSTVKGVTSRQISSALRDMGITGVLKDIFFPRTGSGKIMFRPSISNIEFNEENHKSFNITDYEKQ